MTRYAPKFVGWTVFTALLIVLCFYFIDRPVAQYFHGIDNNAFIKQFFLLFTFLGDGWLYLVIPVPIYLLARKGYPQIAKGALFIFATAAVSGIAVNLFKIIFARPRPQFYFNDHLYAFQWFRVDHDLASFPSGHSTTAMGVWFAFALLFPTWRIPLLLVGASVAFSRVVVNMHFPADIVAGSYLGILVALILYHIIYISPKERSHAL